MPAGEAAETIERRTFPDPIDEGALRAIRFLDEERLHRVWRIPRGFLVATNLRCFEVERRIELFSRGDWSVGPSFLYYNLRAPSVMLHRYLRLAEDREPDPLVVHVYVRHPEVVAREIESARISGRDEWLRRRATAEASLRVARARWESGDRVLIHSPEGERIKMRCTYCGNLMDVAVEQCPYCGAPTR